jgi:hypothetical protein
VNSLLRIATLGVHFTLTPLNLAAEPLEETTPKTLVFQWGVRIDSGSFKRTRDSSPVLVSTVLTMKLSTLVMVSGPGRVDKH